MYKKIIFSLLFLSLIVTNGFSAEKPSSSKVGSAAKESTFNAVSTSMVVFGVLMVAGIIVACCLAKTSKGSTTVSS